MCLAARCRFGVMVRIMIHLIKHNPLWLTLILVYYYFCYYYTHSDNHSAHEYKLRTRRGILIDIRIVVVQFGICTGFIKTSVAYIRYREAKNCVDRILHEPKERIVGIKHGI